MPYFNELREVPYDAGLMFDIVADVERYPQFLPWCVGARVGDRRQGGPDIIIERDELMVGFKAFRERYTSEVTLDRGQMTITAVHVAGPFKHLNSRWTFSSLPTQTPGQLTAVGFTLDFAFGNPVLAYVAERFFSEAARKMIAAFEARAAALARIPIS